MVAIAWAIGIVGFEGDSFYIQISPFDEAPSISSHKKSRS